MKRPTTTLGWTQTATVVGVVGGLIMIGIALSGISKTEKTVTELGNLVNSSTKQLEILINQSNTQNELLQTENRAVVELAHQTIMQAYNLEKSHRVDISSCYYYPDEQKIEFQLDVVYNTEPNNSNSNWLPSTIAFEIRPVMYGKLQDKESQKEHYNFRSYLDSKLVIPSQESEWAFTLSDHFEYIKENKDENSILYVRTQYILTPYSIAKQIPLSDEFERDGHLLVGLEKNEDERWVMIKDNKNIVCK